MSKSSGSVKSAMLLRNKYCLKFEETIYVTRSCVIFGGTLMEGEGGHGSVHRYI